jgi:hypothetical protein
MLHAFMVPLVEMCVVRFSRDFNEGGVAKRISWIGVGDAVWISWYEAGQSRTGEHRATSAQMS